MFLYWLFGFFLCGVPKPPTRNKPLFSLVILVRFGLVEPERTAVSWEHLTPVVLRDLKTKKVFPWMGWWLDGICLSVCTSGRQRLQIPPTPPKFNKPNCFHISYLGLWLFYFLLFLPFFPFNCFHLNFFYGFISSWNPATRMRQHSSSDPSSAGAQGLLCMPYIRQSCL